MLDSAASGSLSGLVKWFSIVDALLALFLVDLRRRATIKRREVAASSVGRHRGPTALQVLLAGAPADANGAHHIGTIQHR